MARILAVDDDPQILRVVELHLSRAGHQVVTVQDSSACLRLMTQSIFDVALVDYEMPSPDGLEVLRQLREIQPLCLRVLMSGRLALPVLIEAVNRGEVVHVLEKPFESRQLLEAVQVATSSREHLKAVFRDASEDELLQERRQLDECLEQGALRIALQPIIDTLEERTYGYEALMRSTHPAFKSPLDVLEAAERQGRIDDVAVLVTNRVSEWMTKMPDTQRVFLNAHPKDLCSERLVEHRVARLGEWAERLVFEVTERAHLPDVNRWTEAIERLRAAGFSMAVDDLGAGYNSLSVLAELKPQFIKVDMSIVRGVEENRRKQELIRLLARFAAASDAIVIGEGVETERESAALVDCGVLFQQGYYFGRPSLDPEL